MTDRDREVPPDLVDLFEKEKAGYAHFEAGKSAAYAKVLERAALVAPLEPSPRAARLTAARGATALGAKATAAISAAAFAGGVALGRATVIPPALGPAPTVTVFVPAAPPSSSSAPPAPSTSAPAPPPSVSTGSTPVRPTRGTLAQEGALIEAARTALTRDRPADALAAADRHAREFPRGALAEEREVLAVTALISLGRFAEADARRARFLRDFPASLLVPPSPPERAP